MPPPTSRGSTNHSKARQGTTSVYVSYEIAGQTTQSVKRSSPVNNLLYLFQDERYCMALTAYNRQHKKDIKELKPLQQKALDALVGGADCICCLPTGFGKSLVYEMLPFVDPNSLVVVVVPLNAIIAQQIQKLGSMAICLSKGKDLPTNHIADGTVRYIFTHPEDILNNRKITDFFRQDNVKRLNIYLVIDEAHCILDWGEDFRPDYRQLCQLRAIFSCRVLALSATVTSVGQKQIMKNLLMENCKTVITCPTKENIEFIVLKRPSATARGNCSTTPYDYIFEPFLKELKHMGASFPITVIYCKLIQWIGYARDPDNLL
ncbi:recQ-like DNA helicase Blm [Mercenaria mercenaria]|uniref:recQ-like DNA helicase Blm n=1 Tax=Mercenaria mercenaria TaxID=6596 RepID=UPI00234E4772|nr:recQ-like DNA helicase Blm [Mercenaria mercenaria]